MSREHEQAIDSAMMQAKLYGALSVVQVLTEIEKAEWEQKLKQARADVIEAAQTVQPDGVRT